MASLHRGFTKDMKEPRKGATSKEQLRKDRVVGVAIVMILAALMALMIWLASLGTATSGGIHEFWPMMP